MTPSPSDWMERSLAVLRALKADVVLWSQVRAEVDAFFAAHPTEHRDAHSEGLLTVLVFERLTASQAETQNQKIA
ncbi:MAG: hypothetical protein ACFUZC_16470 [Chthoniobacteraceae bacterium]